MPLFSMFLDFGGCSFLNHQDLVRAASLSKVISLPHYVRREVKVTKWAATQLVWNGTKITNLDLHPEYREIVWMLIRKAYPNKQRAMAGIAIVYDMEQYRYEEDLSDIIDTVPASIFDSCDGSWCPWDQILDNLDDWIVQTDKWTFADFQKELDCNITQYKNIKDNNNTDG